ncbi:MULTISPECIES: DNA-binding protein [unclassified Cryobacterium]|uniref:DNA-binding protein n=1 Tax=unclassified Cryobacterium TaxID=2649013 RepID=UPI001069A70B|nr:MULTISPECIES: DNA-binding protein [unclassified Cryobacterium]TFC55548.1 DNA-binding protein [Cryobacterium sp. TMB3-1-2]TFC72896.1 DNA-binding protein [Cryobacterium sp. TMB3-15]TFC76402.1 DNA-binding protein [Cryobacterium sp. TMB3-10]TFC88569.1 DNA-binding protein [Cryobacterium sp. TMT4-31]TFD43617.1 DNA-binding protein [Cryobacterium sp. TMB3-12]
MGHFLSAETAAALARLTELDANAAAPPLERMRAIRAVLHHLDADPAALASVRDALSDGAGWPEIADAAGLKPTAAKWRWQGTDSDIAARLDAGRKRSARPSSVPTDLPGHSVAEAAALLGVSVQAVYLQVSRGKLVSRTVELADGRSYKRVILPGDALPSTTESAETDPEKPTP